MAKQYDVIIVGAGPAGLFAAHYIARHSGLRIALIDQGPLPRERSCPVNQSEQCLGCDPCHILCGFGGAGLFSDGKLNFAPRMGQTDLTQFMDLEEASALIEETEAIFSAHGMDGPVYPTHAEKARNIRKDARREGIELLLIKQKHLGSDKLPEYIAGMLKGIEDRGVDIRPNTQVRDILLNNGAVRGVATSQGEIHAPRVILAPGRVGAEWMASMAQNLGIGVTQRGIEIGARVEVPNDILQDITDIIYDPVFFVQTGKYDDQTRTFCTNFGGFVSQENYQDFVCVNGHAYLNRKSDNANFAFLSKVVLTEPVTDNRSYGESIGRLATLIGGGRPILQRLGDLKRGRRSTWQRIGKGYIEPTLKNVVCGDIAMALPERLLTNLAEGLEKLNKVVPGVANKETLLYAPEIKFFATQIETDRRLETKINGLYVAGDGAGVAGNIVSASATGLIPAKAILGKDYKGEGTENRAPSEEA
ncbi:MAG: FAD-dependent oxidoreductase [Desulfohalobiaceae bacterium]|nr:FAD-dependent oxidoreductase [Desulfohalobiaceae bacterium]